MTAPEPRWIRRLRRSAVALSVMAALWIVFAEVTLLRPPRDLPAATPHTLVIDALGTRHFGSSYFRRHGGVWEMGLYGTPVDLGDAHARLISDVMFRVEGEMMKLFARFVPSAALRSFITTLVRAQHWHLDRNFPRERLYEIAAEARALAEHDPYADFLPTYHRVLTLHALYDISLSFEHSPMLGCTALFASGAHTTDGHTYIGRNFDMEIDPVFDTDKTVVLYHPRGGIPFASVAWPGLTGVVTGMNRAGIFVAVHGGRAGSATTRGVPVPTTVRTVLEHAHTLDEAIAIVRADTAMVSHILFVVDGDRGQGVVIERAPD
ncbi:MAG: C45 family peptidase, partial [Deltaproteobacteria bacterium]